jgi:hypothetical protein
MNAIHDFLSDQVRAMEHFNDTRHICKYRSVSHFVLENGRYWTPRKKPKEFQWRELKNCYGNSTLLAMQNDDLAYCEGYALGQFFPMMHAWCVTPDGEVIDTTWRSLGVEYYGIAIRPDYLAYRMANQDDYGLIDCWKKRWPMLYAEPKLWRHPINDL